MSMMYFKITKCVLYVFFILTPNNSATYAPEYKCDSPYTCGGDRTEQPCGCDDLCEIYGDCCPDYTGGRDPISSKSTSVTSQGPNTDNPPASTSTATQERAESDAIREGNSNSSRTISNTDNPQALTSTVIQERTDSDTTRDRGEGNSSDSTPVISEGNSSDITANNRSSAVNCTLVDTEEHLNSSDLQTNPKSVGTADDAMDRSTTDQSISSDIDDGTSERTGQFMSDHSKGHTDDQNKVHGADQEADQEADLEEDLKEDLKDDQFIRSDIDATNAQENDFINSDKDDDTNTLPNPDLSHVTCVQFTYTREAYLLVSKCPSNWPRGYVHEMCHSNVMYGIVPVYEIPVVSERTKLSYRNTFCAICHTERVSDLRYWSSGQICNGKRSSLNKYLSCDIFRYTDPTRRMCLPSIDHCIREESGISAKNRSADPLHSYSEYDEAVKNCAKYIDYILVSTDSTPSSSNQIQQYKNHYCILCSTGVHDPNNVMCLREWKINVQRLRNYLQLGRVDKDMTLEIETKCHEHRIYYHALQYCLIHRCPGGFINRENICDPSTTFIVEVCTFDKHDVQDVYNTLRSGWPRPRTRVMTEDGECLQMRLSLEPAYDMSETNMRLVFSMIHRYTKLSILSLTMSADTKVRYTDNCTRMSHIGSQEDNHQVVYELIQNRTLSPFFNFTNEKITNSSDYQLSAEICDYVVGCKVIEAKKLALELKMKSWVYDIVDSKQRLGVCVEDVEAYESRRRIKQNRQLTAFYDQYYKHVTEEPDQVHDVRNKSGIRENSAPNVRVGTLLVYVPTLIACVIHLA